MNTLNQGDLSINGDVVAYEGQVSVTPGTRKRSFFPQVAGQKIITTDISTNMSKIVIPIRATPANLAYFEELYNNGDNNTIVFRDKSYLACAMEELPEAKDLDLVDFIFFGDPAS